MTSSGLLQLASGEYLDARENVLLIGNSGTGKTHLATALGFAACAQGKRVRHWGATELVTHMLEMREARDLKRFPEVGEASAVLVPVRLVSLRKDMPDSGTGARHGIGQGRR